MEPLIMTIVLTKCRDHLQSCVQKVAIKVFNSHQPSIPLTLGFLDAYQKWLIIYLVGLVCVRQWVSVESFFPVK